MKKEFEQANKEIIGNQKQITDQVNSLNKKIAHYQRLQEKRETMTKNTAKKLRKHGCRETNILQWCKSANSVEIKIKELTQTISQFKKANLQYQFEPSIYREIEETRQYLNICIQSLCKNEVSFFTQPE